MKLQVGSWVGADVENPGEEVTPNHSGHQTLRESCNGLGWKGPL